MQAFEFTSVTANGVIPIPECYQNKIIDTVRVIVLTQDIDEVKPTSKQKTFHYIGIDMSGFKFNRDEANER
ncbi:hypothetical protein AGMMS50293_26020 [Spirochaetia bacterium]|nr:hypothetical protein AGMMS50293_26020 [Spirochaetia bacterium]